MAKEDSYKDKCKLRCKINCKAKWAGSYKDKFQDSSNSRRLFKDNSTGREGGGELGPNEFHKKCCNTIIKTILGIYVKVFNHCLQVVLLRLHRSCPI